jgi:hypothetical protein
MELARHCDMRPYIDSQIALEKTEGQARYGCKLHATYTEFLHRFEEAQGERDEVLTNNWNTLPEALRPQLETPIYKSNIIKQHQLISG